MSRQDSDVSGRLFLMQSTEETRIEVNRSARTAGGTSAKYFIEKTQVLQPIGTIWRDRQW
jgi:hypothetical protein